MIKILGHWGIEDFCFFIVLFMLKLGENKTFVSVLKEEKMEDKRRRGVIEEALPLTSPYVLGQVIAILGLGFSISG